MSKKKYDVCAKVGEYTDQQTGEQRPRFKNVGAVVQTENGHVLLLDKTFNPAGLPSDRETVLLNLFVPKPRDQPQQPAQQEPPDDSGEPFDDPIPF